MRIVRAASGDGVMHLLVQGPGESIDRREFSDVVACMNYQADLERRLVFDGYMLERFSDRRLREGDSRTATRERRRPMILFL